MDVVKYDNCLRMFVLPTIEKVASEIDTNDLDLACINEHKSFHHIKYYRLHT